MSVMARNNTPATRAARRPRPEPVYSQAELRERRRTGLIVTLGRLITEYRLTLGAQIHLVSPLDVERRAREGQIPPPPAWLTQRIGSR